MSVASNNLLLSFYGDDFTGSTDAMESLTLAGIPTALFIDPPDAATLARYPDLRAVGVAGLTRSMMSEAMELELRPVLTSLKSLGAAVVHYKVCSTFDSSPQVGSIGRAIDVGSEIFSGTPFVPLLVGAPALGRYCVFGNLFARCGDDAVPYRLDRHPSMSRHPITPADESDLRVHLSRQTSKRIALFDVLKLALPPLAASAALSELVANRPDIILFDVLYQHHLETLGRLIDSYASPDRPLFVVGSSGVETALGAHWSAQAVVKPPKALPQPQPARPLLAVSGSCSPVTERQIEWAVSHGFQEVPLDTPALAKPHTAEAALRRAADAVCARLASGNHVVVHTSVGSGDPRIVPTSAVLSAGDGSELSVKTQSAKLLGEALGSIVRAAVVRTGIRRVLVAGGDTSGYVARRLGIESLEMIAPLAPGAPLCRARAPKSPADRLEINFKGGQVGSQDYFAAVANGRSHQS